MVLEKICFKKGGIASAPRNTNKILYLNLSLSGCPTRILGHWLLLPRLGTVLLLHKHILEASKRLYASFGLPNNPTSLHARMYLKQIIFSLCVSVFTINKTGISITDMLFAWITNILISIPEIEFTDFYPE